MEIMEKGKLKMSNRKFKMIWIPVISIVVILCLAANIAASIFSQSLDTYLGRGERKIIKNGDMSSEDAQYYDQRYEDTDSEDGSVAYALQVAKSITDEGEILMKNDDVLPLEKGAEVTVFGYRYLEPVYGGTGSGNVDVSKDWVSTAQECMEEYFTVNKEVTDIMENAVAKEVTADEIKDANGEEEQKDFVGASTSIKEYDPVIYESAAASCEGTTGVVFAGRVGGEGANLQKTEYADGTRHELELSQYEKDTIKFAKEHCDKVIAIINTSNVMELGLLTSGELEVDGIIWIGGPGATGFESLVQIMTGEINPSGKTADIWDADLTANPTYCNFGDFSTFTNTLDYEITGGKPKGLYYVEYEEGVYYGYRYYETASDLGYMDYYENVIFPFGYGLSYTEFEQSIKEVKETDTEMTFVIEVNNIGDIDGKETVQLYYNPPYTDFDIENKIEKPTKNLFAFDKVEVKAGETEEVTITVNKEDMASYSYTHDNGDGTKGCWMLENGDYEIILGKDSHEEWDTANITVDETIWYANDNPRESEINAQSAMDEEGNLLNYPAAAEEDSDAGYTAATNQFSEVTEYMEEEATILIRADWEGTQPTAPEEKALPEELLEEATNFDPENDELLGDHKGSAVYADELAGSNADNGLTLSDMRGKSYYDESWDLLLDQIDYDSEELIPLLYEAAFATGKLSSVGKPESIDHDGPQGWGLTGADGGPETCAYCTQTVVAATWNEELAYSYGEAIGQEALTIGYTGWYGPGINIHRNAFCGRNFEYYSEDALLSGKLAAKCISGAQDQGVICYMKHFLMNEYEGTVNSLSSWATEQTIREVYLKAFEIPIKEASMTIRYISDEDGTMSTKVMRGSTGIMTAGNMIGATWCSAHYPLINNVVCGEWGYEGAITTDMFVQVTPNIEAKVFRAGGSQKMWFMPTDSEDILDTDNPTNRLAIRNAIKKICYACANSNVMQGIAPGSTMEYGIAPWEIGLIIADVAIGVFAAVMIIVMIRRTKDEKLHPENYTKSENQGQ